MGGTGSKKKRSLKEILEERDQKNTIGVVGHVGVGKIGMIQHFIYRCWMVNQPVGPLRGTLPSKKDDLSFLFFDLIYLLAIDSKFTAMRDHLIGRSNGFVLLYSTHSKSSFEELNHFYEAICRLKEDKLFDPPLILVANRFNPELERQVSCEDGERLARSWNIPFFEICVKNDLEKIDQIFSQLYQIILSPSQKQQQLCMIKKAR